MRARQSDRFDTGEYGVLGWLLAGADALAQSNAEDGILIGRAIESLPVDLAEEAKTHLLEGRVHRWLGAVSGQPGGVPVRDARLAHQPDAAGHPGLFVVGDYLYESTLNGVLRSARAATDLVDQWLPRNCVA